MEAPAFAIGFNSIVPPYETVAEDGLLKKIELAQANIDRTRAELAARAGMLRRGCRYWKKSAFGVL
ncbi:MAG: Benzylsuccinate synthase subunit A [Desulfotomaculum sp. 46_80]|nr:MAG: Benzylsuccinate synthase subunit A [Desulfotomaculum sp. 46_80]